MDAVAQHLAADVQAIQARDRLHRVVACDPLPGPAGEAFAPAPVQCQGLTFRPAVGGDVILLKQLNSPLIRRTAELVEFLHKVKCGELPEDSAPPNTPYDDEEACEMVFQFTRPIAEVRQALRAGRAEFRREALETIADTRSYAELNELVALAEAAYLDGLRTVQRYKAEEADGAEERNFSTPPAKTPTGLAGGSTTTPASAATTG